MKTENIQRITGMIGFARRARKCIIGTDLICRAMPKGEIEVVVISHTASDSTKKKLSTKSEFYGIHSIEAGLDTECLGKILGKTGDVAAVAITDKGLAEEIKKAAVSQ